MKLIIAAASVGSKKFYDIDRRVYKFVSSVWEFYDLAEQIKAGSNRKDGMKPVWSEEQASEMLCSEAMQDLFQANYSSPYEDEDRRASNEPRPSGSGQRNKRKRPQNDSPFMSKKFLQNYWWNYLLRKVEFMRLGAKNPLNGAGNLNRSGGTAVEYDTTLAFN